MVVEGPGERAHPELFELRGNGVPVLDDLMFPSTVISHSEVAFTNVIQLARAAAVQPPVEEDVYDNVQVVR